MSASNAEILPKELDGVTIMAEKLTINSDPSLAAAVAKLAGWYQAHKYLRVTVQFGIDRSVAQNAKLWPMLADISEQVEWYGAMYEPEGWKDILTGSFKKAGFVPNIEGTGLVSIGMSTSKMAASEFSDLIEYLYAFGVHQNVSWSEPSKAAFQKYRQEA